jgi:hypothetical protein
VITLESIERLPPGDYLREAFITLRFHGFTQSSKKPMYVVAVKREQPAFKASKTAYSPSQALLIVEGFREKL